MELLSVRYGVPVCMLMRANRREFASGVKSGMAVRIPGRDFCAEGTEARRHTVVRGETVYALSAKYAVTMRAILEANGLTHPSGIEEGMTLLIPPSGRIYTVGATETLDDIAKKTGVSAEALMEANGAKSVYRGMQLVIPE